MATHDKEIVNTMKKRVILIENGVIAGDFMKGTYKDHVDKNKNSAKSKEEQQIVKDTEKIIKEKRKKAREIEQTTKAIDISEIKSKKKKEKTNS